MSKNIVLHDGTYENLQKIRLKSSLEQNKMISFDEIVWSLMEEKNKSTNNEEQI